MSTFRQRNSSSGEESAGAESDGEENLTDRILKNRPKAVAKRRIPATIKNDELKTEQINDGNDEEMDKKEAAPSAGKLWAETAVMQTLEEGIGSTSSTAKLDRGVESYLTKTTKFDLANRKRHRPDDISDSIWDNDQQMVEEEKGKPPPDANEPSNEEKSATSEELIKEEVNVKMDPVVDLWDGVDTGAVELPIEREQQQRNNNKQWRGRGRGGWNGGNQFKRFKQDQADFGGGGGWRGGRGGGKWQWQRGGGQGGGNAGQQKKMLPPEKFVPRRLIAADYDQQKLFNTVLDPETLTDGELVKTLVEALGEKEPAIIEKAVEFTGKQLAVEIFKECQEVEKSGGMLTKKGDRRKAPGGVFLELFNKREEITEGQKKAMYQLGSELMRKSGCHPKWWDKREKKKEAKTAMELDTAEAAKADEASPPDLDNEDLPASSELIKPNIIGEVTGEIVTEESSKNIENSSK